jgi:hypothetical protein
MRQIADIGPLWPSRFTPVLKPGEKEPFQEDSAARSLAARKTSDVTNMPV